VETIGEGMQTVIIVIHLMVVAAMIGVVLLQKSEGGGLGIGSTGGFLSSRGTANVLTRTTAILAATFFATSLVLSVLAGWDRKPRSIIQNTGGPTQQTPAGPLGQQGGGVLDKLRQQEQSAPPAPGPQVPRSQ
jgi:preprotein translocase subunit SecG